jgi:hypothetical protein
MNEPTRETTPTPILPTGAIGLWSQAAGFMERCDRLCRHLADEMQGTFRAIGEIIPAQRKAVTAAAQIVDPKFAGEVFERVKFWEEVEGKPVLRKGRLAVVMEKDPSGQARSGHLEVR